ncbi:hypothetical protein F4821DRAFT_183973 [Hypoxylon rubiginosum]|uniref:Uncharacterized protein n=1 Tax=Hypoxylon rubiginosum TaxID=110542 RepID=A0ACC0CU00_9PEZI|nr:hypothetical protein F4821DRAFT_183973 [Hypoxylon rubiginosum]
MCHWENSRSFSPIRVVVVQLRWARAFSGGNLIEVLQQDRGAPISPTALPCYNPVSTDETRAVYTAMAREFSGIGHWYTCINGHPFTVGKCGMPMQQARCPECGEAVGGVRHMFAEGVQ